MFRIGEFAKRIGRSPSTVRRWEREGRVTAQRTASGQRYFPDVDVRRVLQPGFDASTRKTVVYCRVSSPGQKDDLASQVEAMEQFCRGRGLAVDAWVREVGGGMNLQRRNGCEIIVADQESLSPREEMVQDLLAIVRTFSCRLYGLRRYEKQLKDELAGGTG